MRPEGIRRKILYSLIVNGLGRRAAEVGEWPAGGESGIRTHGTVSRTHAFQACALSHSAISPKRPLMKARADFCK